METIWEQFEETLKSHDWYYDYSDDHSVYIRGQNADYRLIMLYNDMAAMDKKRATELWNQYCPDFRKREIELF